MNTARNDDDIFAEALELPPAERAGFLARACAGDDALRGRIEELLAHAAKTNGFLESPLATVTSAAPAPEEQPRDVIGRYKLLEKIGEGGCGVVWMAEQSEPVRRRVALKVIKLGMDTREVIARFEAERQALALMDHPNIARVFDGGATDTGRPYFVMELVRGLPITRYCDEAKLTPAQRLELFILVCQAVQHAHQKGVIHRDLKPSNILVTVNDGVAVPKVIDFGIAKATQGPLTDKTLFTAFQQFIGTPVYMSPEQADLSSVDIDTRSDIYSLGVLLYELLTGAPPFDPKALLASGLVELRRIIREVEPARPSTRVATLGEAERTTLGRARSLAPAQLSVALRGDLDWIVMRCLEKDRARRYETANALAMDLRRHLAHEPVVARSPSAAYLIQKLVRRHRVAFAATAAIAATLVVGVAASTWQAVRATRAEHVAQVSEQRALQGEQEQSRLRQRAETSELATRRRAYAADMNLVQQALAINNLGRAQDLLNRHRPKAGELDLRGWEWRYLWQFCRSEAQATLMDREENSIMSLAVSADGEWVAAGRRFRGVLDLLNLHTRERLRLAAGTFSVVVAFAPNQPLLAIALRGDGVALGPASKASIVHPAGSHRVILWDMRTRQTVRELPLTGACYGLAFSADGSTLAAASAGSSGEISVWRVADGKQLSVYLAVSFTDSFISRFATDARHTRAVTSVNRELAMVELASGRKLWAEDTRAENNSYALSPDEKMVATGFGAGNKGIIKLWDAATGRALGQLEGHHGWVTNLLFMPDGRRLVSCSADQSIRIWDIETRTLLRTLRGHRNEVWRLALLPGGKTLVTGCKDGSALLWDLEAPSRAQGPAVFARTNRPWTLTSDGSAILQLNDAAQVVRHSPPANREPELVVDANAGRGAWVIFDGRRPVLATSTPQAGVRIIDWSRRETLGEFGLGWTSDEEPGWSFSEGSFSADGTKLAAMFAHRPTGRLRFREWETTGGRTTRAHEFAGEASGGGTAFSHDLSAQVRTRQITSEYRRLDFRTGEVVPLKLDAVEPGHGSGFSADGRLLAVPSLQSYVRIFDVSTGEAQATFGGFMFGVHSAAFNADSTRLAVGSTTFEGLTLWDLTGHERVLTLEADASVIRRIAFSADGSAIAAQEQFGRIYWWRAPSWTEIEAAEKSAR